jgi:hypothetical protein
MIDSKMFDDEEPANANGGANGGDHEEERDEDDEGVEEGSEHEMTEFWLVPENSNDIENIFYFMNKYPAADDMDDNSDENDEFFDGEDMEQMNINDDNDPRFAD